MTVKNLVGTLTHGAFSAARHPLGTTARAVGVAKGVADTGIGLVRGAVSVTQSPDAAPEHEDAVQEAVERAEQEVQEPETSVEADDRPAGPPLREPLPAAPQRTPEELASAPVEPFATEPKAASRDSAHGGQPGDREEVDGYVEEAQPDTDAYVSVETPVGTAGAGAGYNPDTAEGDLQQPDTAPLLDPSVAKEIRSETDVLRKAADSDKG